MFMIILGLESLHNNRIVKLDRQPEIKLDKNSKNANSKGYEAVYLWFHVHCVGSTIRIKV